MLYVARINPRKIFRTRDYYAAKEDWELLETKVVAKAENLFLPTVRNVMSAGREGIDKNDSSGLKTIVDDIRACGLFPFHLAYRSPQWLGKDFFSGMGAIQEELERIGEDMTLAIRQDSTQLVQSGQFVIFLV